MKTRIDSLNEEIRVLLSNLASERQFSASLSASPENIFLNSTRRVRMLV